MSYKIIIKEFDNNISSYVNQLKEKIKDITFDTNKSVEFTISQQLDTNRSTCIINFANDWTKKNKNSFYSSTIIKKRLKLREGFDNQWLPLYIGKSKDLYRRIKEHIDLSPEKSTYAMKLKHRKNLEGVEFRFTTLEFDVTNYDFIIPYVERSLREEYYPLVGKQ